MIEPVRLTAVGTAYGSLRLPRAAVAAGWGDPGGRGELAVCADDEDALTLGWQAASSALAAVGAAPGSVDHLCWGSGRPPYAEGPSWATLACALGLPSNVGGLLTAGSPHAGVEALVAAWDAVAAGAAGRALVVCSEDPRPGPGTGWERQAAAAAAAVLVEPAGRRNGEPPGPATLVDRVSRAEPALDRYRGAAESDTRDVYDPRCYREELFLPAIREVAGALRGRAELTGWALPDPDGRLGAAAAKLVGSPPTAPGLGYAGAAAALLDAARLFAVPGTVGVVGHGGGRTTGVLVRVVGAVPGAGAVPNEPGRQADYPEVLRVRGQLQPTAEPVPMGVPPGSAMFVRGAREVLQLLGARCVDCGSVATPPSVHPRCPGCGGAKFTEVALARTGVVHTFVVNQAMPPPFTAPLPLAVVDLADGARVMLQVTGPAHGLAVGAPVRLVLRRYAVERGASVYGFKALLDRPPAADRPGAGGSVDGEREG